MRILYSLALYLCAPLALCYLLLRGLRNRAYLRRIPERFGCIRRPASAKPALWVHAVSVGEVQAVRLLVRRLLEGYPDHRVLLTTVTPTGAAQVKALFADKVEHRYLPYDLPHAVCLFLQRVRPRALLIIETEIWPNLLHHCKRRDIPVFLVNARLSPRSQRAYRRLPGFTAAALGCITHIAARGEEDAGRFLALGASPDRVSVTGNLKFDVDAPADDAAPAQSSSRAFAAGRPVWLAASTHAGEEEQVLAAFHQVRQSVADCLLLLAPRHPERFDKVYKLCRGHGLEAVRRRAGHLAGRAPRDAAVYLLDTLGELPRFYAYADVAFVGGSLVAAGGHNVLEATRLGVPVIVGRHTVNFSEIIDLLKVADALTIVADATQLATATLRLLQDPDLRRTRGRRGQELVRQRQGATDAVMVLLDRFLRYRDASLKSMTVRH